MLSLGMETYLTQSERNTMWRHLLISSLLLVLATASVILWAATVVNRDRARDMTLLPSEVKYPKNFPIFFSCEEAALEVLISLCLCVCLSPS